MLPIFMGFIGSSSYVMVMWPLGLAVTTIQGTLFAWAASRFFVEARRTGELEVLLTTPLGAATLLSAQWNRLKRILHWPAAVMVAPIPLMGLFTTLTNRSYPPGAMGAYFLLNSMLSAVDVVFGIAALCWMGRW